MWERDSPFAFGDDMSNSLRNRIQLEQESGLVDFYSMPYDDLIKAGMPTLTPDQQRDVDNWESGLAQLANQHNNASHFGADTSELEGKIRDHAGSLHGKFKPRDAALLTRMGARKVKEAVSAKEPALSEHPDEQKWAAKYNMTPEQLRQQDIQMTESPTLPSPGEGASEQEHNTFRMFTDQKLQAHAREKERINHLQSQPPPVGGHPMGLHPKTESAIQAYI